MKTLTLAALFLCASLAYSQSATSSVQCNHSAEHHICIFADGSVIETFNTPAGYSRFEWTAEQWRCNKITNTPAQFKACLAAPQRSSTTDRISSCLSGYADDVCKTITTSCSGKSTFTAAQCSQVQNYLKSRQ